MKCKIKCMSLGLQDGVRAWEVTNDGKLWPCCFYANAWLEQTPYVVEDADIMAAHNEDPNWNDLNVYTVKQIEQHDIYQRYIYHEGWDSDTPPRLCVEECAAVIDEYTGEERSAAKIQLTRG
jgi:hypothetical protein